MLVRKLNSAYAARCGQPVCIGMVSLMVPRDNMSVAARGRTTPIFMAGCARAALHGDDVCSEESPTTTGSMHVALLHGLVRNTSSVARCLHA